jgi:hypothetical protein
MNEKKNKKTVGQAEKEILVGDEDWWWDPALWILARSPPLKHISFHQSAAPLDMGFPRGFPAFIL